MPRLRKVNDVGGAMNTTHLQHVRHGIGAVRPYVYGPTNLWRLAKEAFGAEECADRAPRLARLR